MIVTLADIRRVAMHEGERLPCVSGLKVFFDREGFDWDTIVRDGIELEDFKKIEHPLVPKIVEDLENK